MGAAQNDLAKEWASMPMANDAEGMHRLKQLRSKFQQDLTKGAKVSKRGRQIANMSFKDITQEEALIQINKTHTNITRIVWY